MRDTYQMTADVLRGQGAVLEQLRAGHPVIAAVRDGGHYVVLTGVNSDGSIAINDPNSPSAGHNFWGQDTRSVPASTVFGHSTGFWYLHPVQ